MANNPKLIASPEKQIEIEIVFRGVSAQQNGSSHFGASHRALHTALRFQLNSALDLRPVSLRASNRSNALDHRDVSRNISNMRCSVSLPDETPRRELKIRRAAEYF